MGVHEFDVVRWLTGQSVASVAAVQTPALDAQARPDADNAQALLGLSGGATAAVSLGLLRRARPGRAPPRCANGGRRRGAAGCCSGLGGVEREHRDRDVT
jgi:hypothetical protein